MRDITALIVSFYRYEYLEKCVSSLREVYPEIDIVIGNNGPEDKRKEDLAKKYGARYFQLPFDCGICYGRNFLVNQIDTKYTLVGDDDFFYTKETRLGKMYKVIKENPEFDLVGGRIFEGGTVRDYQGFIHEYPDHFVYERLIVDESKMVQECDITFNYFIAKTDALRRVRWDEQIKVAYEHSTYFIDFKRAGFKVAFCPLSIVVHKPEIVVENREEYQQYKYFRTRRSDKKRFFERFGIKYVVGMNGMRDVFSDNSLDDVDFCITTFMRKPALERLLKSIEAYYPEAHIIVGDQTFNVDYYRALWPTLKFKHKPTALNLPYDCGISFARNYMVKWSKRKYKLILEDDFVFTPNTDVGKLKEIADHTGKITAGSMIQAGNKRHFEHNFKLDGEILYHTPDANIYQEHNGIKYKETGCVLNFMLVTDQVWDNNLKVYEHTDFFLRYPEAIYVPEVEIGHAPFDEPAYREKRNREEFLIKLMDKWHITEIRYLNRMYFRKRRGKLISGRLKANEK